MSKLDELFKDYGTKRSHNLSKDQFGSILKLIPALLVATSDGVMDSREWVLVDKLTRMMGDELIPDDVENVVEKEELLMRSIRDEIGYIMRTISTWQEAIIQAVKEEIKDTVRDQEFVEEAMFMFARTSADYSDEEEEKIDELCGQLGISHE